MREEVGRVARACTASSGEDPRGKHSNPPAFLFLPASPLPSLPSCLASSLSSFLHRPLPLSKALVLGPHRARLPARGDPPCRFARPQVRMAFTRGRDGNFKTGYRETGRGGGAKGCDVKEGEQYGPSFPLPFLPPFSSFPPAAPPQDPARTCPQGLVHDRQDSRHAVLGLPGLEGRAEAVRMAGEAAERKQEPERAGGGGNKGEGGMSAGPAGKENELDESKRSMHKRSWSF